MYLFWNIVLDFELFIGLILLILYGLYSLRNQNIYLSDVYFFCRSWPILVFLAFAYNCSHAGNLSLLDSVGTLDFYLCLIFVCLLPSFRSFESVLLLLFAYIAGLLMLHSTDFVSFYICLEAQNFCFFVLCGLQSRMSGAFSVEASLKFLLLSAVSSGVMLYMFSLLYLRTGTTSFLDYSLIGTGWGDTVESFRASGGPLGVSAPSAYALESFLLLAAIMFKLGAAPLHLWVVDIYGGVKRQLLLYLSTAPKLSLFGFWVNSLQGIWTENSIFTYAAFSFLLGSIGAYSQPALRNLFAYSTINEIGFLLLAVETAGFDSLFQHLGVYIVSQFLLWNLSDKKFFNVLAVSLAGLPPLAGFFGKAWILWSATAAASYSLLIIALVSTCIALVYYLRVIRLFWSIPVNNVRTIQYDLPRSIGATIASYSGSNYYVNYCSPARSAHSSSNVYLTSACLVFLVLSPLFIIKPFVL